MMFTTEQKRSKNLKIFAVLIILALMVTMFAACAKTQTEDTKLTDAQNVGEDVGSEAESAPAKIQPNLDESANFGGHEFKILTRFSTNGDWIDWVPRDIEAVEENGDPINDAVYRRNVYLEDKYNFKIKQVAKESYAADLKKAISAGDEAFDMVEYPMRETPGAAQSGYFLDMNEIANLDFTQPWWDQAARAALSFGNKMYFMSGDILMVNNDTCTGFVFNKELIKELGLDDPYPLVKAGTWTMDKLYDYCKGAAKDLNGDGAMNYKDDRYGLIGQRDTLISFLHSAGEFICKKDDSDYPVITFGSERSYAAMEACFNVMYEDFTHNAHHLEGKVPAIYPVSEEMFMSNRVLFMWVRLRIVENLRSMDTDFGILPLPKLDGNQEIYRTDVISYTGCLMAIPKTASNPDRTGHILEAIAAEAKYSTMPAYYDITLKTKMARDEDSSEMLDIIFKNRIWDIGEFSNYGDFSWKLIELSMKNNKDIASLFEKYQPKIQKDIDKAIEKFEKLD
jgi:ABC-type glycerol-3-phosphate transport system substrate-binding protein